MRTRVLLAGLATALFSTAASADEINLQEVFSGTGDPNSQKLLNSIFGPLFPVEGGAGETIISTLIANFNLIFLALGMALLLYNILVGVAQTANDGQLFGKNASTLWAPIRTVVAIGLLIPMPTGYNGVQHVVAYVTNVGTGAASFFWSETADAVVDQKVRMTGIDHQAKDMDLIAALWRMEICMHSYNVAVSAGGDGLEGVQSQWYRNNGSGVYKLRYETPSVGIGCGEIRLPEKTEAFDRFAGTGAYDTFVRAMMTRIETTRDLISTEANGVVSSMASQTPSAPASNIATAYIQPYREGIKAALATYMDRDTLESKIVDFGNDARTTTLGRTNTDGTASDVVISESMKSGGWTQAGFYYQTVARISADTNAIAGASPSITYGGLITASMNPDGFAAGRVAAAQVGVWNWMRGADTKEFLAAMGKNYAMSINWLTESAVASGIPELARSNAITGDHISDDSAFLPSSGQIGMMMSLLDPTSGGQVDPLIGVIQLGQAVSFIAGAAIVGLAVLGGVPVFGGAAATFSTLVGWILSGVGVAAVTMAFILPMIPTLIWVLAIGAFLMLIIQAVFAGPLWAIAHLSMDGEGLSGQSARRGYLMLLSIFVTPMLMVFGLLASMVIFRILATLLNSGIFLAVTGAQSLGSSGVTGTSYWMGIFVVLVFICFAYVIIIEFSFRMISWLPNAVLNVLDAWISGIGVNEGDVQGAQDSRLAGGSVIANNSAQASIASGKKRHKDLMDERKKRTQALLTGARA